MQNIQAKQEPPHVHIVIHNNKHSAFQLPDKQLYKIVTIFRDRVNDQSYYLEKLSEIKNKLGEPQRHYQDELFTIPIEHNVWESREEQLDLRYGAGHVYEVRIQKALQKDKIKQEQLNNSI